MKEAEKRYEKIANQAIKQVKKVIGDLQVDDLTKISSLLPRDEDGYSDYEQEIYSVMRGIFNAAANDEYLAYTKKPSARACNSWADGCYGDEWETIRDAIACGQEAASQLLEEEEEEEKDLKN